MSSTGTSGDEALATATRLLLRSTRRALAAGCPDTPLAAPPAAVRTQARQALEALFADDGPATRGQQPARRAAAAPPVWTDQHLAGWLDAAQAQCISLPSQQPVVVMASGGGPRQLPVLTPLLALWLAREGVQVLLHGPLSNPLGLTSAEILRGLGLTPAIHAGEVAQAWSRREPAFMATSTLCPALHPLLQRARGAAWRGLAQRLARLLNPVVSAPVLRVVHQGPHDCARVLSHWAQAQAATVMLLRGADNEPVADLRRRPRITTWLHGAPQPAHSCTAQRLGGAALPLWPQHADAPTTALYVQAVLSGERPAPAPVAAQVALILGVMPKLQQRSGSN